MNRELKMLDRRGFTTLDILMVVVILGVLSMVALPRFFNTQDRGHLAAAKIEVTQYRNALAMYAADFDAYPHGLNSIGDMQAAMVDSKGKEYITLPPGESFDFISYRLDALSGYLLRVRAHDHDRTVIRATAEGITTE